MRVLPANWYHAIRHDPASKKLDYRSTPLLPARDQGLAMSTSPPSAKSCDWDFIPKLDPPILRRDPASPLTPVFTVGVLNCPNPYSFPPHLKGTGPLCAESKLPTFPDPRPSSQLTPNQGGGRIKGLQKNFRGGIAGLGRVIWWHMHI